MFIDIVGVIPELVWKNLTCIRITDVVYVAVVGVTRILIEFKMDLLCHPKINK